MGEILPYWKHPMKQEGHLQATCWRTSFQPWSQPPVQSRHRLLWSTPLAHSRSYFLSSLTDFSPCIHANSKFDIQFSFLVLQGPSCSVEKQKKKLEFFPFTFECSSLCLDLSFHDCSFSFHDQLLLRWFYSIGFEWMHRLSAPEKHKHCCRWIYPWLSARSPQQWPCPPHCYSLLPWAPT